MKFPPASLRQPSTVTCPPEVWSFLSAPFCAMVHAADNSSIETSKKVFFFMVIPPLVVVRAAASGLHRDPWKCRAHYGVQLGETSSNEITDTDGGVSVLVSAFAAMEPGTGSPDGFSPVTCTLWPMFWYMFCVFPVS